MHCPGNTAAKNSALGVEALQDMKRNIAALKIERVGTLVFPRPLVKRHERTVFFCRLTTQWC